MKLELKHLAPYLPYKLYCQTLDNNEKHLTKKELIFLSPDCVKVEFMKGFPLRVLKFNEIKPILRHLSDLTKEIEVNGEKFVPIIKLLDIETCAEWSKTNYIECSNGVNEYWCYFKNEPKYFVFGYNLERNYFYKHDNDGYNESVKNQLDLFNKLLEWHFDVFGLIDKGLAVDINTL